MLGLALPISISNFTISVWPFSAARCKAVLLNNYNMHINRTHSTEKVLLQSEYPHFVKN